MVTHRQIHCLSSRSELDPAAEAANDENILRFQDEEGPKASTADMIKLLKDFMRAKSRTPGHVESVSVRFP